jgi:hypothetical protein
MSTPIASSSSWTARAAASGEPTPSRVRPSVRKTSSAKRLLLSLLITARYVESGSETCRASTRAPRRPSAGEATEAERGLRGLVHDAESALDNDAAGLERSPERRRSEVRRDRHGHLAPHVPEPLTIWPSTLTGSSGSSRRMCTRACAPLATVRASLTISSPEWSRDRVDLGRLARQPRHHPERDHVLVERERGDRCREVVVQVARVPSGRAGAALERKEASPTRSPAHRVDAERVELIDEAVEDLVLPPEEAVGDPRVSGPVEDEVAVEHAVDDVAVQ